MATINQAIGIIAAQKPRARKDKVVRLYALELLNDLQERRSAGKAYIDTSKHTEYELLNGAGNWQQYSFGGCSLIATADIIDRLGNAYDRKKLEQGIIITHSGEGYSGDYWLTLQGQALFHAWLLIRQAIREANNGGRNNAN